MLKELFGNPWAFWVGMRYLRSKKNSRFLSLITLLSIGGVAVGVTTLIVVLSVMDGFEAELKKRLMSADVHVVISPTSRVPGFESGRVPTTSLGDVEARIRALPEVTSLLPVLSTEAILRTERDAVVDAGGKLQIQTQPRVTGVILKGLSDEALARLKPQWVETVSASTRGVILGAELSRGRPRISAGDAVTLISPVETEGPLESVPRMKRVKVDAIYESGIPEQELHTLFAPLSVVESFLRRSVVVTDWEIVLKDFDSGPRVAKKIREWLPEYRVRDWVDLNSHLFASLRLERMAMFVILAFIVVVASFNIVTTLTMMVLEKKREIAILGAMGASRAQVGAVFLAEGVLIGAVGVVGGAVLGVGLCLVLKRYDIIELPAIYYDRTLPVTFDPVYYVSVMVIAFVIVLVACIYPSKRAARMNPIEGIRAG